MEKGKTGTKRTPSHSSRAHSSKKKRIGNKGEVPSEKNLLKKLVEDWKFRDTDLARRFAANGIAKALIKLEEDGFQCSESDPLLIISVDLTNNDSIGYFNEGNYGIAATTNGHLPGPNVGQQGPRAVGEFLNAYEGVEDKSGGGLTILYFEAMGTLHAVQEEFSQEAQFCRLGPLMSTRMGLPQEDSLVNFFTLDKIRAEPMRYGNFNMTP